ncbi:MAG: tail-specific protease [Candidatus Cloacimonadota bacterium]|nr:MAG: tail-specific protease [Candidatus Cloacimonadota bacterium]
MNTKLINTMKILTVIFALVLATNFFITESVGFNSSDGINQDTLEVLAPKNQYILENQLISTILSRYHYKDVQLDDSLSSIIYDKYISALDHGKNYLLASDLDQFEKYRYKLDDNLNKGNILPFYEIFNLYRDRMQARVDYIDTILVAEFDYTIDEEFHANRNEVDWAETYNDLNELWRLRIKNDALSLKMNGKDWEEIVKNLSKRYENYERLLSQYNSEDVFQLAMNSYSGSIDPHTNYLSPITSENFNIEMSLSLEGIGARLMSENGYTTIVEIIPGGPAFKSKVLSADDRITAVAQGEDGEFVDVVGWRINDVVQLIRGPKESIVRLMVLPAEGGLDATPIEISLVRDKIKLEDQAAKSEILEITNEGLPYKVGVIKIPKFYTDFEAQRKGDKDYKSTSRDVKKLLEELKEENVDAVIIDLRSNGGGSLTEAVEVAGLFIEEGPVVQVRDMNNNVDVVKDPDSEIIYGGNIAVLVNRFSASASEIFAGAMQNYGRGIVIGEQTYGKGTVQNLIDLNRLASSRKDKLGQVKITIAKYYRIDGGSTQNLGVIPDITFPSYVNPEDFGESSEPYALKWDQIDAAEYKMFGDLSEIMPRLSKLSDERTNNNPEFDYLKDDILEYKEAVLKNSLSLNEEVRLKEKEEKEEKEFQRENERRKIKGLKLLEKGETPPEDEEDDSDFLINETALIITDMIRLSSGISKVQ